MANSVVLPFCLLICVVSACSRPARPPDDATFAEFGAWRRRTVTINQLPKYVKYGDLKRFFGQVNGTIDDISFESKNPTSATIKAHVEFDNVSSARDARQLLAGHKWRNFLNSLTREK